MPPIQLSMRHVHVLKSPTEKRGWRYARQKFVCADCLMDAALKELATSSATAVACSFCGRSSGEPIAAHLNGLVGAVYDGIRREWAPTDRPPLEEGEDPLDSLDETIRREVVTTEELIGRAVSNPGLLRDVVSRILARFWIRETLFPPADSSLPSAWEDFCAQVKYKSRYFFE